MKVVLFCGGLGMRLREYSESIPKPMVPIGHQPILWHVMKYYAEYGHNDFILCLGYKAEVIKKFFLEYNECISNDFIFSDGGRQLELLSRDIDRWNITFVGTGLRSNIGQRLKAIEKHVATDEYFLANYTDGLSDIPLQKVIDRIQNTGKTACFVSVKPRATFHLVNADASGKVQSIEHIRSGKALLNGGFFVFHRRIFSFIKDGEDLVDKPFSRLIAEGELLTYRHDGFWTCMDTFKEKQELDDIFESGNAPWVIWN
jgi:glucose-1-phosphate cytidylyltransferase